LVNVGQYNVATAQRHDNVVCIGANQGHPQELRKHIGLCAYESFVDEDCGGEAMAVGMIE
jgi:hypothetical protein